MANPSLQIGNSNWAIKEDNLLGYSTAGTRFVPQPITMTRESAGTRVNPQGLIETVELLGSEEIDNGSFNDGTDYWDEVGNSSLVVGDYQGRTNVANINILGTANSDRIKQDFDYVDGVTYLISLDVYLVSGNFKCDTSNSVVPYDFVATNITGSWQTLTGYFTATSTGTNGLWLRSSQQINQFYVSNISVKESTKNNLARVDYDGTASSLLVEPMRTNLITYSEDFENSYYNVNNGVTATDDSTTSPSGLDNASKILGGLDNAYIGILQAYTTTSTTVTTSVFLKQDTISDVGLYYSGDLGDGANDNLDVDLSSGTLTSIGSALTASITPYSDGWYKVTSTYTTKASGSTLGIRLYSLTAGSFYAWGLQLEAGSYSTSYIPNFGTALGVTRVQDQYSKTGISNLIGQAEGVLFIEMAALSNDGTNRGVSLNNGTQTNRLLLYFSAASNQIAVISTGFAGSIIYTLPDETLFNKIAVRYKANDITLWVDGDSRGTPIISATIPTFTALKFDSGSGSSPFFGKAKQLKIYDTYLSNGEMQTLTT